ncbi:MAG: hypothetical protein H0X66_19190 [Verrucomicrobia bacterium]|nr:hypothetical protein [Verrucomicrobiota bacterium]
MKALQQYFAAAIAIAAALACLGAVAFDKLRKSEENAIPANTSIGMTNHPTHVRQPESPRVLTGETNFAGKPVSVNCSTCHATTEPNLELRNAADLKEFHQGLHFNHGNLSCVSCHNPGNYDTLRLADGKQVEFANTMQLCSQCHGPQARDFRHGAHGGMTGHWDLTKGSRERNTCTDCHDPHSPAYPTVMPVFKPKDRNFHPPKAH